MKQTYRSQYQLVEKLRSDLSTKDSVAIHALKTLYQSQTESEKMFSTASSSNGVGFNKRDAKILTHIHYCLSVFGSLNGYQLSIVKRLVPKYAAQLVRQSIAKGLIRKVDGKYIW